MFIYEENMQNLPDASLLWKVHALGEVLSSSTQLSFNERSALQFSRESKTTIHHTRLAYRELKKRAINTLQSTQGIESLLDNFPYIVESALGELLEEWAAKETMRIPQSRDEVGKRYPRAYNIARAFIEETGGVIDREIVVEFLETYQWQSPLSVRELDIFPNMVRYVLLEEVLRVIEVTLSTFAEVENAERWFVHILAIIKKKEHTLALTNVTSQLAEEYKIVPIHFSSHLLQRISQSGRERDLRIVSKWLRLTLARQGEGHMHLADQISGLERKRASDINAFISSLRWLVQIRWDKISSSLNAVDRMLARDPMGAYAGLSDETRGLYRRTVVRIADRRGYMMLKLHARRFGLHERSVMKRQNSQYGAHPMSDIFSSMKASHYLNACSVIARHPCFVSSAMSLLTQLKHTSVASQPSPSY